VIVILMLTMQMEFSNLYKALAFFFAGLYAVTLLLFKRNPTRKMSKLVETGGSIFLLGMCALNAFAL
jgi:flagellar biogenesis protein FliO